MPLFFFCLGAIVASFMGVVSARLHTGHSVVTGRSRCDVCNTILPPFMLLPIVSYLGSGGRARCCDAPLSFVGPLGEFLLGSLFVLAYFTLGLTPALPLLLVGLSLTLALVLYDASHQILPPALLYALVVVALLERALIAGEWEAFLSALYMALGVGAFFLALHYGSKGRAMGFADAPFAFALALIVGADRALSGLAFSFWIGAGIGIIVLLRRPKGTRMGIEVPFAPFLAAGFLLSYFVISWNPFAPLVDLIALMRGV